MSKREEAGQLGTSLFRANDRELRVVIAVATYRRPEKLAVLLKHLERLKLTSSELSATTAQILVIDNDALCSAALVVAAADPALSIEVVNEPRRGVVHARNAALEAAIERQADFLAFVDDDDYPDPAWLVRLLSTATESDADLVTGPVIDVFDFEAPTWVDPRAPNRADGELVPEAYTGNLLLRVASLGPNRFDYTFNLTGGEDVEFTRRLIASGARAVWSPSAIVYTPRTPAETRFCHVARQTYRSCRIGVVARAKVEGGNVRLAAKGLSLMVLSTLSMPATALPSRSFHRAILRFVAGTGIARGAISRGTIRSWWEDS